MRRSPFDAARRLLFAVNAGSGTLSVLSANGRNVSLQQVVNTGGAFPDNVAVYGNLVYVLNAGGAGALLVTRFSGTPVPSGFVPVPGPQQFKSAYFPPVTWAGRVLA